MAEKLTGKQKAAILMIALGQDAAAEVFKYLKPDEIEDLTFEIAKVNKVQLDQKEKVYEEFNEMMVAQQYISQGGINYARELLQKAVGENKAVEIITKLTSNLQVRPFDFIQRTESEQILNFISGEHPQIIALIISYLPADKAGEIMSHLPSEKQIDIARRIAQMERTSPEMIREVERILERKISTVMGQDYTMTGGIDALVEILNNVDRTTEKTIIEGLEEAEATLAEEVKKKMFVFEDLILLDDKSVQQVLKNVENKDLTMALKGSSEEVAEKIFKNMSKRAADNLREDMEYTGPVRVRDVQEAQQRIVAVVRKLEESGEIQIARGSEDELIV
ncbi:flagellar motor switch protein FliG [Hypnocyclicus thermotrophus]|uniref:Flagellar motor switch protein FliG n=1 Tax=Hypnocyclicus thermotrophus TaxID=1627895 RepID=A0AA46I5C6_9FUSO|nr:flagellar motor switch protein FliG [Hypnocyclicus thermotrophus]TDT69139.1 flagellar motor switch protein FliG [Hypnocyclicus thermotrophus]